MKFEIIFKYTAESVCCVINAKDKYEAVDIYANEIGDRDAWRSFIAGEIGENERAKKVAEEMTKEWEKHIYIPKTTHELNILTNIK